MQITAALPAIKVSDFVSLNRMKPSDPSVPWFSRAVKAGLGICLLVGGAWPAIAQIQSVPVADSTFAAYAGATAPVAFQADGKILVTGVSFLSQGVNQQGVARLNADGTLDTTFVDGTGPNSGSISIVVVQPDKKILVGGTFTSFSGQTASGLVRLNSDGTLDSSFLYDGPTNVTQVVLSVSGDLLILAGPGDQIRRHSMNGATKMLLPRPLQQLPGGDPSGGGAPEFGPGSITAINVAELSNGMILGAFYIYDNAGYPGQGNESWYVELFAYDGSGARIANWPVIQPARVGHHAGSVDNTTQIIPVSSGGFYVLGPEFAFNHQPPVLALYKSDGSVDPSFVAPRMIPHDPSGVFLGSGLTGALDSNGLLVVSGQIFLDPAYPNDPWSTVRLLASGAIDPAFGLPGAVYPSIADNPVFLGVKHGAAPGGDRVFAQSYGGPMTAYKFANALVLGSASTLPTVQTVTAGKGVSLSPPLSAANSHWNIQWEVSTDAGATWKNLANDSTYQGVTTPTLAIANTVSALNGALYRYVSTSTQGTINSNSTTLAVEPLFFPYPAAISIDSANNLYVGDTSVHTIQKINSSFQVSNFIGSSGQTGTTDGTGASALFNQPGGITATAAGALTVSDTSNATIRSVTTAGVVTTLAGSSSSRGGTDGIGSAALFSAPVGISQNSTGTFYVADSTNHAIRMVTANGTVTTFAGTAGSSGASDGTGTGARFNNPTGVAVDAAGNVYVADTTNNLIRQITPAGVVTTLAGVAGVAGSQDGTGAGALFNQPSGIVVENRPNTEAIKYYLYVADTGNSSIRKVSSRGEVTTLAGLSTIGGLKDGTGNGAWFNQPKALTIDSAGNLFVADTGNAAIRQVTPLGVVTTLPLTSPGPMITAQPASLTVTAGDNASFSVTVTSPTPVIYQWKKDGADIPGANAATLSITSASSANAGNYSVVVTNIVGSATSSAATLTVNATPPPPPAASTPSGGGGAMNVWFVGALVLLLGVRGLKRRPLGN